MKRLMKATINLLKSSDKIISKNALYNNYLLLVKVLESLSIEKIELDVEGVKIDDHKEYLSILSELTELTASLSLKITNDPLGQAIVMTMLSNLVLVDVDSRLSNDNEVDKDAPDDINLEDVIE